MHDPVRFWERAVMPVSQPIGCDRFGRCYRAACVILLGFKCMVKGGMSVVGQTLPSLHCDATGRGVALLDPHGDLAEQDSNLGPAN
jgi:hypothetical protein